jgi:hypothetical protein
MATNRDEFIAARWELCHKRFAFFAGPIVNLRSFFFPMSKIIDDGSRIWSEVKNGNHKLLFAVEHLSYDRTGKLRDQLVLSSDISNANVTFSEVGSLLWDPVYLG